MSEASSHPDEPAAVSPASARAAPRLTRIELAWLPIVGLALLAIYLPGLGNALVYDDAYLNEGLFTEYASLLPLRVRMLSYGSFVWVQALFGEGWWKQRLFNLVLHACTVLALWAFYREVLRHVSPQRDENAAAPYHRSPALGVAIGFFALNPVAVYAVGYLIQRSIVMATLFTVLALFFLSRGLRLRHIPSYAAALACYVLAVMSKEHAVLAPLVGVPLYIIVARPPASRLVIRAGAGVAVVAIAGAILYLRYGDILGKAFDEFSRLYLDQLAKLNPDARTHAYGLSILNETWLFFRYGVDWVLPWAGWMSINLRPPFPVSFLTFPQVLGVLGYIAVIAGGFVLLLRYRDGRALLGLSLLMPALLFGTELATVWVQDPFALYRSYLWAIGIPGLVFFALHGPAPRTMLGIGFVLGGLLMWQALDRVISMATPESVWTDAIAKLPDDPRSVGRWFPYLNRGSSYVEQDRFREALRDFQVSSSLGDQGMGVFNMGAILAARGRHAEALAAYDRAEKEGYNLYNLPFQKGLSLLALGRPRDALAQMEATIGMDPPSPMRELALLQLGRAAVQAGERDKAAGALEQLVQREPKNREGRYLLGMVYVMRNEPQRALSVLDPLVRDDPNGNAYYARALAHYGLRHKAEALADIDAAIHRGLDSPNVREWRTKIEALP